MDGVPRSEVTRILLQLAGSDAHDRRSRDRLFELIYAELHRIAGNLMKRERRDHTLRPTALVHEAYLRLVDQTRIESKNRSHFLLIAARVMRRVLVDHARRRSAAKRGGGLQRITLDDEIATSKDNSLEVLAFDESLERLAALNERVARVVELRVFAGMDMEEVAVCLGIAPRTAYDDWKLARRWLGQELAKEAH